jgi:predicted MFS family arabinose efflux permease
MTTLSPTRLLCLVLLPFGFAYFLSYAFRNMNALIADQLRADLEIGSTELGLLTAVLFLAMALVQIPFGAALDRFGPRKVQASLLCLAIIGAMIDSQADGFVGLLFGRALIGIGTATSLMAGLKAIVLWAPTERIASANGTLIMLGALGAVAVTAPAETIVATFGWRGVFVVFAVLSLLATMVIGALVPEQPATMPPNDSAKTIKLREIYADRRFQRIAPVSMLCIGTSWALQGLWAAPWLTHVAWLDRPTVVRHLLAMGVALAAGAVALGWITDRLKLRGFAGELVLASVAAMSLLAQIALVADLPLPPALPWMIIAVAGAATTISYAILPGYFAKSMSARANAALNLLHLLAAFSLQLAIGGVVDLWPEVDGKPPAAAYHAALAIVALLQVAGLAWFVATGSFRREIVFGVRHPLLQALAPRPRLPRRDPYAEALATYAHHIGSARSQLHFWRRLGVATIALCAILVAMTMSMSSTGIVAHVVTAGLAVPTVESVAARPMVPPISLAGNGFDERNPSTARLRREAWRSCRTAASDAVSICSNVAKSI